MEIRNEAGEKEGNRKTEWPKLKKSQKKTRNEGNLTAKSGIKRRKEY